ncbi:MAG: TIGR03013 family PEP-CTERM/XrtA system glycosyltransferase [Rhodocyclaceae bacterium]|jgi:sugar transferase (PEP-CTERM system associated)|nr:TIGR03013 family PEP-CTERM/XrtA system glycosyltransferase [Rhodocyclaceae bacterium]
MLKVFSHYFPAHTLQQVLLDLLLLFVAVLATVGLVADHAGDWVGLSAVALVFALVMVLLNSVTGLYRPVTTLQSVSAVWVKLVFSVVISVPVAFVLFHLMAWETLTGPAARWWVLALLVAFLTLRCFFNRNFSSAFFSPRILIIGTGADARAVEYALTHPVRRGVDIVGFYTPGLDEKVEVEPERILRAEGRLLQLVKEQKVSQIIVAVRERRGGVLPIRELLDCKLAGVRVLDLSSFFEHTQGQVRLDSLRASWLIYGDGFRQGMVRSFVKRSFDLLAACVLLILALPVMLVTALLILIEDGAPVFYRQERVGLGGRLFSVIKFRSMRRDAERDGKPRWAQSNDDRVTRVGRVIRKLRIDELPQLLNVLSGDMSLVGPRPERPFFVDRLADEIPFYAVRHCVKPGVTGWAQVRYQYGSSVDDAIQKLQYDLYYVKNHTLMLDILVLFETVRVVMTGEGAQ